MRSIARVPVIKTNMAECSKIANKYEQFRCQNVNEEAKRTVRSVLEMQNCTLKMVEKKFRADRPPWYNSELHNLKKS